MELSTKSIEEFAGSEQLLKVDAVVQELSLAMDNYLKQEEVRRKRREKEKERQERLREEGKLMTKGVTPPHRLSIARDGASHVESPNSLFDRTWYR